MADQIRNKFVSWTLNVVKEIKEIPAKNNPTSNIYGVGVNLALVQPTASSSPASTPYYNQVGVDSIEPHGPAAKAGLQSGDVIVEVDSKKFDDGGIYLPDDVACVIRGPEGSQVGVVVERGCSGERIKFVLTREPIGRVAGIMNSPPSSPAKKKMMQQEEKGSSVDKKQSSEKQGKKKRQGNSSQNKKQGEKKQVRSNTSCEGQKNNENESVVTTATAESKKEALPNKLNNLESLSLAEEEHKEKDLASSAEDSDQFDTDTAEAPCHIFCLPSFGTPLIPTTRTRSSSIDDEISQAEEKTADDYNDHNEEISSSVGDDSQWEMISERSGSAILISFSGSMSGASFCSASPSVLKNKFVLTESTGDEEYIEHVVLPTDTLQGLCLAYKLSATRLRMENSFSGNSLQMAPKKLKIPTTPTNNAISKATTTTTTTTTSKGRRMIRTQDKTSKEFKLYAFVAEIPSMELVEAKAYLDLSNWDLDEALRSAREDEGWNLKGGFEPTSAVGAASGSGGGLSPQPSFDLSSPMVIAAVAKPKALTAQDIYEAPPPYEGAGVELKDIKQSS